MIETMKYLIFALAFLTGCGKSPILNHIDESKLMSEPGRELLQQNCALEFPQAKLCASITWTQKPTDERSGSFTLKLWAKESGTEEHGPYQAPPSPEEPWVKLWMPSMGHGSSPVKITTQAPGIYNVTDVFFVMPGDWEMRLQLRALVAGTQDQFTVIEQAVQKIHI